MFSEFNEFLSEYDVSPEEVERQREIIRKQGMEERRRRWLWFLHIGLKKRHFSIAIRALCKSVWEMSQMALMAIGLLVAISWSGWWAIAIVAFLFVGNLPEAMKKEEPE